MSEQKKNHYRVTGVKGIQHDGLAEKGEEEY
jgi:hypothetical protein